jgi:Zn-dependent protease with chaperone function
VKFDPALPDDRVNVEGGHPLREAALLVFGITLAAFGLFATVAIAVELVVPHVSPELEARIFANSSVLEWWQGNREEGEDPRETEVGAVLERLAAHWSENPYALRALVVDDDDLNAFAFPGGLVVVTSGLLESVTSENELAFVLAHEIGHFRNRDHLRGLGRAVAYGLVVGIFGVGGAGGAAELAGTAGRFTEAGFSREQESDADDFALGLVHAEYGHVGGAPTFFERLPKPDGAVERELAGYLSTHPLSEERIEALRELARTRGWAATGPLVPLSRTVTEAGIVT